MSTNCYIWVKVDNASKGKEMALNKKLLHCYNNKDNGFKYDIPRTIIEDDCVYIGIYCHWDGGIFGVGGELLKHYNDYEKALNLCLCGFCSGVFQEVVPYKGWRNDKWQYVKPMQEKEIEYNSYTYLFKNNKWYECKISKNDRKYNVPLEKLLKK